MCREILVVDDSESVLGLMDLLLRRRGFSVLKAKSADMALEILSRSTPDLIILDFMMPDIDGIELCRMIRSHALTADIPVIIQSARYEAQLKQRGLAAGANEYLSKLIPPRDLLNKVDQILQVSTGSSQV